MRKKQVMIVILTLIIILSISGIRRNNIVTRDYSKLKADTTLDFGWTLMEFEKRLMYFVYKVYNPKNPNDIKEGIDSLREIMTEEQYNKLISIAGEFDENKQSNISNVVVRYSKGENNTDGMARGYVEFTLEIDGLRQNKIIEFVFNHEAKIFKHYIWHGIVR